MTDKQKLSLCKEIIENEFEYGCDDKEAYMAILNAILTIITFGKSD